VSNPEIHPTLTSLQVTGLEVRFGGVLAVDNVSFATGAKELVGMIGPNGAGKTTLLDAIGGFVPHVGSVRLAGRDLAGMAPQQRARAGVSRSFQDARLFPALTVREVLTLAIQRHLEDPGTIAQLTGWPTVRIQERDLARRTNQVLDQFGLGDYADKFISELSTGTRRVVELASVYVQEPRVILLDEPSSGIAQKEVEALAEVILRLRTMSGAGILMVEHDIPLVRHVAERLLVLEYGQLIADGEVEKVLEMPEVIAGYLGTDQRAIVRSGRMATGTIVEVAAEEEAQVTMAVPPGLPPSDSFRIPVPQLGGAAAAAALVMGLVAFTAGPLPQSQVAKVNKPGVAALAPIPSPSLGPPLLPPQVEIPALPVTIPALPVFEAAIPSPASANPTPSPSPSTSPSPCVIPSPSPVIGLPLPIPSPPPLPVCPAAP
jgi:ABC-type branched-subunit amino acid transport system ATPase component